MHESHTSEETRLLMFTRSLFPCSVKSMHDALRLPWWKMHRCIPPCRSRWKRLNKKEKKHLNKVENFYSTSLPDLYSALHREASWVSAGYKCLMYLGRHCDSVLRQDRGNKVDKYKTSSGASLCTPLCWNTYCEIITPQKKKERKQRSHEKEMHLAESSRFASKHFSGRFYILTET